MCVFLQPHKPGARHNLTAEHSGTRTGAERSNEARLKPGAPRPRPCRSPWSPLSDSQMAWRSGCHGPRPGCPKSRAWTGAATLAGGVTESKVDIRPRGPRGAGCLPGEAQGGQGTGARVESKVVAGVGQHAQSSCPEHPQGRPCLMSPQPDAPSVGLWGGQTAVRSRTQP